MSSLAARSRGVGRHRPASTAAVVAGLALLVAPALIGDAIVSRPDRAVTDLAAGAPGPGTGDAGADGTAAAGGDGVPAMPAADRPAPVGVAAPLPTPSPPVALAIPAIGVAGPLEYLGVDGAGRLAPPVDPVLAGWFAGGVEPGQAGPAVIAGHVDSRSGPAVFYRLGDLRPGDTVDVTRADGSLVSFRIDDVAEHPKDEFPTAAVYGPVPGAALRLITCSGRFDRSTGHYRSNLVVYATLV
jgi:Sortase domain